MATDRLSSSLCLAEQQHEYSAPVSEAYKKISRFRRLPQPRSVLGDEAMHYYSYSWTQ